ncbi:stage VI sporulation protein F [Litchfieldia alkalitelluris]|uniref:stage VI sporulation protein F n=1 Tax=Litchfieldia alkalitelluris TaxID=304268 RepID=UPI0009970E87|nr:stage VI sporulation protein F [Litchfieldia alkalitelluris]
MPDMFKGVENKTGIKMEELMKLVQSLKNADLQDETTIRELTQKLSRMTGKKVPKQVEDKIVDILVKQKKNIDPQTISKMMNKKK